ncbi:helix-turn-helix transcriptional regulator [Agrobacterium salinitolerans]|uniref:helix-turn-helix domain-containing protein n=1 Tax=Agrobacterium salinitolerans TaxID=1183413 RepID=UPI0022B81717|nr:helix-turn-helix transcriptional regulator [Agrobacterium salinitolerans]MCZ7857074.1 helix-turn-helix transcriptional regulator [Agrobacterium salinitolerans]
MDDIEFNLSDPRPAFREIEAERKRRGVHLQEMEEITDVSVNSVYAWRSGARSPMVSHLVKFAEAMGFEVVMRRKK